MIRIENLTFAYDTHPVFERFTCDLPRACYCYGPNGSGKTTILQLIAGVLRPASGLIMLDDQSTWCASLFLDHSILFEDLTMRTHLAWMQQNFDKVWVEQMSRQFDIESYADKQPCGMSAGERQWCALCLTFCMPCDVLLLDEPMRSLDSEKRTRLLEILQEYAPTHPVIVTGHHCGTDDYRDILSPVQLSRNPENLV